MSCHGFFLVGYKEFGSLLITDYTSTVNSSTLEAAMNPGVTILEHRLPGSFW
jgi:hypothetical protein